MLNTVYKLLEKPAIYDLIQTILGGNRVYAYIQTLLRQKLSSVPACKVLDVGCGTGVFAESFPGSYCGLDINPEYIKKAQKTLAGTFVCGDATALPFDSDSFPLVFTFGVLHHLDADNRKKMLQEMWRVCAPNGRLLIIDGLIPSTRANIIGYVLAKLDRGRFKMRAPHFEEMITNALESNAHAVFSSYRIFPYELACAEITKNIMRSAEHEREQND